MEVRFWGVRGSVASSGAGVAKIGGNTPCVEVLSQGERLILDAGTGLRGLGEFMLREGRSARATMLFSHLHWDHVQGFPFFSPAYVPTNEFTLYGPGVNGATTLREVLADQMQPPSFPVPLETMRSRMNFCTALHRQVIEVGPFRILPFELPHPQGCLGYRVEADGKCFVYATDVELSAAALTPALGAFFEGADALCLDAQYTPDEYNGVGTVAKRGWGHSTMIDAAEVARATRVKRLLLFHHDPAHNDEQVENMAEEARNVFEPSEPAREGKRIRFHRPLPFCA